MTATPMRFIRLTVIQGGHNPYGYASTNQSSNYAGNSPQYHPQGQGISQPGESSQHPDVSHGQFGYGSSSGYPQYHTANQPTPSNQFSQMNPVPQPWQSQTSFTHNNPPAYQPPIAHGNNGNTMPPQPEWQPAAHPTIPHSTKPNSNNPLAIPNQAQPHSNYQPPYHQQAPQQHQSQPVQNAYSHNQMAHDFPQYPQNPHGAQGTAVPPYLPQTTNNFEQNMQYASHQGASNPPPYNQNGGMIPGPSVATSNLQNSIPMTPSSMDLSATGSQQGGLSHHSNSATPSSHYPGNNMPNNLPTHNPTFAVELPDNQINVTRPPINMQNHPPTGQNHGQPFSQSGVPQQPPQPLSNPMAEPIRYTPTDPQFVSGPWTSPPSTSNNHYPPNRYNNNGGY
jgi:hypothetical protein